VNAQQSFYGASQQKRGDWSVKERVTNIPVGAFNASDQRLSG